MSFEKPAVIIDNGSYDIKAGFACDNHPVSIFRTVVGRPSYLRGSYGREPYEVCIGDDAVARDDLELCRPVQNGLIVHWDNMERVFHHILYRELKVAPEDRAIMLASAVTTGMNDKIKCCEVIFEALNAPAFCVQAQAVLAMYGSGYTTGICVDLGHDTADINPVYEGGLIRYAHMQTNLAAVQLGDYVKELFDARGFDLGKDIQKTIDDVKKKAYVTRDILVVRKDYRKTYTLPSGEEIEVSNEAWMSGELFFNPDGVKEYETDILPLHEAVFKAAMKCDADLRTELYDAIVPCGAMSMIPGLTTRLQVELEDLTHRPVNLLTSPEMYTVAWLGGATYAGLSGSKTWVTRKQYEEYGEKIIRNKFM